MTVAVSDLALEVVLDVLLDGLLDVLLEVLLDVLVVGCEWRRPPLLSLVRTFLSSPPRCRVSSF